MKKPFCLDKWNQELEDPECTIEEVRELIREINPNNISDKDIVKFEDFRDLLLTLVR